MSPLSPSTKPAIICIINGAAGPDTKEKTAERVGAMFAARNAPALVWTAQADNLAELARRAASQAPAIIVAGGGDGTINCIAAAVAGTDIILGVLPIGTLNHFAKDLGIPLGLEEAVNAIVHGEMRRVDIGAVNERVFVNNSSLGIYPRLVRMRERLQGGGASKTMAFVRAIGFVLFRYSRIHVRLESSGEGIRILSTPFVFIGANQYRTEGWNIGTRERMDGGRLWLYLAPSQGLGGLMMLALRALLGRRGDRTVDSFEARECWIKTRRKRVDVATDGEVTRMTSPLHFKIRPGALRVMAPAAKPAAT